MMDSGDAEHELDIEEALHAYSRLISAQSSISIKQ